MIMFMVTCDSFRQKLYGLNRPYYDYYGFYIGRFELKGSSSAFQSVRIKILRVRVEITSVR